MFMINSLEFSRNLISIYKLQQSSIREHIAQLSPLVTRTILGPSSRLEELGQSLCLQVLPLAAARSRSMLIPRTMPGNSVT